MLKGCGKFYCKLYTRRKHPLKLNTHLFHFTLLNAIKSHVKINFFSTFFPFFLTLPKLSPLQGQNSLGSKLFIIYDQTLTFNLCKACDFYAHFSAERWEFKIKIKQFYKFSNFAYNTKVISMTIVNALQTE